MPKLALTLCTMLGTSLALLALACDEAKEVDEDSPAAQASATIAAKDLELAAVVSLIEREDLRDAESLEALINAEDSTIRVDVDGDGERDFVQVHEVESAKPARTERAGAADPADGALTIAGKEGEAVQFELRAMPSAKQESVTPEPVVLVIVQVEVREADRQVVVEARYAPTLVIVGEGEVEHVHVRHIELEHRHDQLVVVGAPFVAWVWFARPIYVGHVHLPPGHAKKLGLDWYGPGKGHGHGRGHHGEFEGHGHREFEGGHGGHGKAKFKGGKHH